ncbi:hypothetical protein ZOSMA_72G00580 [Zostera marina]|uniref:HMA domain-containing protein n=1 Tax=Zostera marina TaxID=29655 RepID=A0A0K9NS46_ZOSMR|nr:hypothetical protein ZOSMA_72G00580 [Zostera marina]
MADKIMILKVDLSCSLCRRKMKKVLKRHQDEWNIKKVNWDEKNNQITLSGPFDPDVLIKKLCCRACKSIKEINIPDPPPEKKPATPPAEKKPATPPPEKKPATPPPEKKPATPPPEKKPATPQPEKKPATPPPEKKPTTPPPEKKPATPPPEKKPATPPPEQEKKPPPPAPVIPQYPMFHMTGQICFCGPCHEKQRSCTCDCSYGHRSCVCDPYGGAGYGGAGYGYGWNYMPPPPVYGKPTCQFFCEEEPGSCTVM